MIADPRRMCSEWTVSPPHTVMKTCVERSAAILAACAASGLAAVLPTAPSPAFDRALASFPRLRALRDAVHGFGRIGQWVEVERPEVFASDWNEYRRSADRTLGR